MRGASLRAVQETLDHESEVVSSLRRAMDQAAPLTASVDAEDLVLHAVDEFHQAFLEDNYRPFIDEELRRLVGDSARTDRPRRLRDH